jgi:Putative peptidoglycan binding domain./G5 domain.
MIQLFNSGCLFQSIPNGTKVDELDLSGLSFQEGREKLEAWAEDKLEETRVLVYNNTELSLSLREIGIELDVERTWERVRNQLGNTVSSVLQIDAAKTSQILHTKLSGLATSGQDASYKIADDKFIVIPAVPGQEMAIDSFVKELEGLSFTKIPAKLIPYIRTEVKSGVLTIRLWGKKNNKTVQLVNEVEQELQFQTERHTDPNLPEGKTILERAGAKGYIVKTWRITRDDQGKETEQFLSCDVYSPVNQILRVGIKDI